MVMSFREETDFESQKQANKIELANLTHKNTMEELSLQLEIAKEQAKKI